MRPVPNPPDAVAFPENEQDVVRVLDWCDRIGAKAIPYGGGSSVVKGIEPQCRVRQGGDDLDAPHGQGAGGRRGEPRRAHPGRHLRTRDRGRAARHALHHAPLHAGLSLLDPGRLDRHALGRPLRHALHPHRRLRRKHPRGDAGRHAGDAPPAGLRRRAQPRPHVHRLRGHFGHHHRSLGAPAQEADVPRLGLRALQELLRRRRCGARDHPGRALSRQLPAAGSARGAAQHPVEQRGGRAGAGLRIRRPSARCLDEAGAGDLRRPRRRARARRPTTRTPIARARPAPGATSSSARRTTASTRWRAASSPRPSRRR